MRVPSASPVLVILAAACVRAPVPVPPPVPPPAPPANRSVVVADDFSLTVCVVRGGLLTDVSVLYNPTTGDSLYEGRLFRDAFPTDSTFAVNAAWYHAYEPIMMRDRRYVIYGLPRALRPGDLVARGTYRGVTVFAEPGDAHPPVLYLPVRPTCEFQPYQTEMGGPVRGG
jgi:hypothetical protein